MLKRTLKMSFKTWAEMDAEPGSKLREAIEAVKRDGRVRWVKDEKMPLVRYKIRLDKEKSRVIVYLYVPVAAYEERFH